LFALTELSISANNFTELPDDFGHLTSLRYLDASNNVLILLPSTVTMLTNLQHLDLSRNRISHLLFQQHFLAPAEMWRNVLDEKTGAVVHINILTNRRHREMPGDGTGLYPADVAKLSGFAHVNTEKYKKKKQYLSLCRIPEWALSKDPDTGWVYFKNNVTGKLTWDPPSSMDQIGALVSLRVLKLRENTMRIIPTSLTKCTAIEHIDITGNCVGELPNDLGKFTALKTLRVSTNELKFVPLTLRSCVELQELNLNSNQLRNIPDFIGFMTSLQLLFVGSNQLKRIPYSLGYLTNLRELQSFNNPLHDPDPKLFDAPLVDSLWWLREKYLEKRQGHAPALGYHRHGVTGEVNEPVPSFNEHIKEAIEKAKGSGELNLQLLNLKTLTHDVATMTSLRELRMDCNPIDFEQFHLPRHLTGLKVLSLRTCQLSLLPQFLETLLDLETLVLEDNSLQLLMDSMIRLRRLVTLDLSKNRLFQLVNFFNNFTVLKVLNLDHNRLEALPTGIGHLRSLHTLRASSNLLRTLPNELTIMKSLRVLTVDRNNLSRVPDGLGVLTLETLKLSYNRYVSMLLFDHRNHLAVIREGYIICLMIFSFQACAPLFASYLSVETYCLSFPRLS
jgi:Leucine-rich repeat (LRR) protein